MITLINKVGAGVAALMLAVSFIPSLSGWQQFYIFALVFNVLDVLSTRRDDK